MWRSQMWAGLLQWCETDESFRRELLIRRTARSEIRELLARERLPTLGAGEFMRRIAAPGCLRHPDGSPVGPEKLAQTSPDRLEELLATGLLVVTGNPMLLQADARPQHTLPGFDGDRAELLRRSLDLLLSARSDGAGDAIERAGADGGPLTRQLASHVLSVSARSPSVIWDGTRVAGMQRLGTLIGAGNRWAGIAESYDRLNACFGDLMRSARGSLRDPLAADLLLCRIATLREPRPWKIAIGLNETRAESEAIARRCLDGGFAAIAPEDPDDTNIRRLRSMVPGDCIVMHLRGRVGAIGRVTRPYYEIDRAEAGPLDRCWWRRVGVEWISGDRDYGDLLTGAKRRFSAIELDWECFRAISAMYRRDPEYDRLFRALHGSWLIRCDDSRYESLLSLDRPLPLRDQWSVAPGERRPSPGDRVFLYHDAAPHGIFGVATVISDPEHTPRDRSGGHRVELIYDVLRERPLSMRAANDDPRLSDWEPPAEQLCHLSPDRTAALSEVLGVSGRRHFVLLSNGSPGAGARPLVSYRVECRSSETVRRLTASAAEGTARCLIYHTRPKNEFVGFGRVAEIVSPGDSAPGEAASVCEAQGPLEVRLDVCRFTRKAGGSKGDCETGAKIGGGDWSADGLTRTILPVSEHDFYRVVAAGMTGSVRTDEVLSLEALAVESGAPIERLEEMERLIRDRGQMIFYGPPGTGKTWLALRLSACLSGGSESRREIVQFHPAYAYEDFIEGIRPQVVEGADESNCLDYPLVRGSFARFCDRARRDPLNTYVFLIDEINRAQVASVFGELMLALEYRGREVRLAHARAVDDETASVLAVPHNVLLLGTMNTADRSIALVDHALRRRFAFYPFFPDDDGFVQPMFEGWLAENAPECAWVARLLGDLNEWLRPEVGRDLLIGHTYFMRPGLDERAVREIWRFQIEPLLAEYFAGVPERLSELDLDDLIWRARERTDGCRRAEPVTQSGPSGAQVQDGRLWWGDGRDD